jgi:hypothetical protein
MNQDLQRREPGTHEPALQGRRARSHRRTFLTALALVLATLGALFGAASQAQAANPAITVVAPSVTCSTDDNYQPSVTVSAWVNKPVTTKVYYHADLYLYYSGGWHRVIQSPRYVTSQGWAQVAFSPTNGYNWRGYYAMARLYVWNNYGAGWAWYTYDSDSCLVH